MGKQKKNRRQQLREIQERRTRYLPKLPQRPFSWGRFLTENQTEIIFIGFIILVSVLVYNLNHPHRKNSAKAAALSSSISPQQIQNLRQKYPQGFQVFVISHNEITALNVDTLPPQLNVNWEVSRVIRLTKDEIRFQIGAISYESNQIAPSLLIKLPRRQGQASSVAQINGIEISIDLLGEYINTGIFFVLGFKKNY
jgi:hypothetical protein